MRRTSPRKFPPNGPLLSPKGLPSHWHGRRRGQCQWQGQHLVNTPGQHAAARRCQPFSCIIARSVVCCQSVSRLSSTVRNHYFAHDLRKDLLWQRGSTERSHLMSRPSISLPIINSARLTGSQRMTGDATRLGDGRVLLRHLQTHPVTPGYYCGTCKRTL